MPMQSYMTVEGKSQGAIDGGCDIKGHEKTIEVVAMNHPIEVPTDPQSGLPTGSRLHRPVKVMKYTDVSSPKLWQAICTGEHLTAVEIQDYRITEEGKEEHYYTTKLEDAIICDMREFFPNTKIEKYGQYKDMEEVEMTYSKITWTYEPDGVSAEDDWKTPKS